MKVMIIITRGDTIGGAQTHIFLLAKNLMLRKIEVLVVYGGNKSHLHHLLKENKIPSCNVECLKKSISFFNDIQAVRKFRKIAREFKPDIISLHSSKVGILGRIAAYSLGIKNILTVHGWAFTEGVSDVKRKVYVLIERFMSQFTDHFIVVSKYDLELARSKKITKDGKLALIYNGVGDLSVEIQEAKACAKEDLHLCMVARFDTPKDQILLIKASKELKGIKINFFGDGPGLVEAQELMKNLNMEEKVHFHGFSSNIPQALAGSDIFVLLSNWEGFPISTVEAMSLGMPVIVSDVGGACECVFEGANGFRIPRGNQIEVEKAIKLFIADKGLIRKMGNESRRIYLENYTAEIMLDKTLNLYKEVLKGSKI